MNGHDEGREEKQRIANDDKQERLLKTTSKQGLINLCKSLREQLAKERQIIEALKKEKFELETSYNFMSQDMDAKRSLCHEQHKQLERERELRKELVRALESGELELRTMYERHTTYKSSTPLWLMQEVLKKFNHEQKEI